MSSSFDNTVPRPGPLKRFMANLVSARQVRSNVAQLTMFANLFQIRLGRVQAVRRVFAVVAHSRAAGARAVGHPAAAAALEGLHTLYARDELPQPMRV